MRRSVEPLRARRQAEEKLPSLRANLEKWQLNLASLETQKGLLVGGKIHDAKRQMILIQAEIVEHEKVAAYDPTKACSVVDSSCQKVRIDFRPVAE